MKNEDKQQFLEAINGCASAYRQPIEKPAIAIFWDILQGYEIGEVSKAFNLHIRESRFFPTPAEIIGHIPSAQRNKHLGPEEAWAIALRSFDERLPIVLTQQILEAKALVQDIWDSGDAIGARMAFRETYNRLLLTAGEVKWFLTQGDDKSLTADVVQKAVDMGRLPSGSAEQYCIGAPVTTPQKLIEQAYRKTGKVSALAKLGMIKAILADEADSDSVAEREQARKQFERTRQDVLNNADPTGEIRKTLDRKQLNELH